MTTPLENYIQQRDEEFEKKFLYWVVLGSTLNDGSIRRFKHTEPDAEEIVSFHTETTTHLIEMMRELLEKQKYNPDNTRFVAEFNNAIDTVLSQLPNQKQS